MQNVENLSFFKVLNKKEWITFIAMIVGMFMAVLDIQIVASSLAEVQAGLLASRDEVSWIQTSYLIAEVIVIPLCGFFARALSTRILFFISAVGFTLSSVLCAIAWDLQSMIVFRAMQGFLGGAMIPTVFATSFAIFPKDKQPYVSIIIGLVVTMAPTFGPIIGGYVTQVISWHWMFLLNFFPGLVVSIILWYGADFDHPNLKIFKSFDWVGVIALAICLGTSEYIFEEGTSKGWFDSELISGLTFISLTSLAIMIYRNLTYHNPVVNLRAFKNLNFTLGCIYNFILGIGLFGVVYLTPSFLSNVARLNSLQIGFVLIVSGFSKMISAPLSGFLYKKINNPKIVLFIGFMIFALGLLLNSHMTSVDNFNELLIPQIMQGLPIMMCLIPINAIALSSLEKSELQNSSSIFNLMRNLGGAFGLAILNTILTNRIRFHYAHLAESMNNKRPAADNFLNEITNYFTIQNLANPDRAALEMLSNLTSKEAFVLAINDCFFAIAVIYIITAATIPLIRKVTPMEPGVGGH